MSIDWIHFTPWSSLVGGMLIGAASAILIIVNGRIAGISGILGGLLIPHKGDIVWRALMVGGMLVTPLLYRAVSGPLNISIDAGWGTLIAAGLLVGVGTRYGSGCTSGHGVCGLSRMSLRSLVATLTFMGAGFVTVYIVRHLLGGLA
jgi:uncharacterized protein